MNDDIDKTVPAGPGGMPRRQDSTEGQVSLVGRTIGGFQIKSLIGRGGMGDVYLAEQDLGAGTKLVAFKTIRTQNLGNDESVQRFQEEAFAAGTMKTSYVVQVVSYGQLDAAEGLPAMHYLVMEYCSGGSLTKYMESFPDKRLPVEEGIRLLRQAAEGFLAAERRVDRDGKPDPLVHRDVKPANLLLQRLDGREQADLRIADFGAVKRHGRSKGSGGLTVLSQTGAPMTPGYASPEQWNWEEVDHRSDMYSLGATFYHALTGQRATPDSDHLGIIRKFVMQTPCLSPNAVLDNVPEPLNRVIQRMTARRPKDRYRSFDDILQQLKVFEQEPRSLTKVWLAAAAAVAVLAALVFVIWPDGKVRAGDLADRYERLQAQVERAQTSDWLASLPSVRKKLADCDVEIGEQLNGLRQRDADAVMPEPALNNNARLSNRVDDLVRLLAAAKEPVEQLQRLETAVAGSTMSRAAALLALQQVQEPEGAPTIRSKKESLSARIVSLYQQHEAKLLELERAFTDPPEVQAREAGATQRAFSELLAEVEKFETAVGLVEDELKPRISALRDAITTAGELEQQLPIWPQNDTGDARPQIKGLIDALQQIDRVPQPQPEILQDWWRGRLNVLGQGWKPALIGFLEQEQASLKQRQDRRQGAQGAEARRILNNETLPEWQVTRGLFESLKGAIESELVFRGGDVRQIRRLADAGLTPTLDYEVAWLRDEYAANERFATACVEAATALDSDELSTCERIQQQARLATKWAQGVGEPRVQTVTGHELPGRMRERLESSVRRFAREIESDFKRDELRLEQAQSTLASLQQALSGMDDGCVKAAAELEQKVGEARTLLQRFAPDVKLLAGNDGVGLTREHANILKRAVDNVIALMQTAQVEDDDVDRWRSAWKNHQLAKADQLWKRILQLDSRDKRNVIDDLRQVAVGVESVDPSRGKDWQRQLRTTEQLLESGALPEQPADWSKQAWDMWVTARPVEPPAGMQAEVRGKSLVCWFPFRQREVVDEKTGKTTVPVEMVLVVPGGDALPFLIDVHEVCAGEFLALGRAIRQRDPGEYFRRRGKHWNKIKSNPTTLVSWTSREVGDVFCAQMYGNQGVSFSLPTPAQWAALPAAAPRPGREQTRDPTEVRIEWLDSAGVIRGLQSGLAEWLTDGTAVGATDYEPDSVTSAVGWKKGVGFRCVWTLQ